MALHRISLLIVAVTFSVGCDRRTPQSAAAQSGPVRTGTGIIRGTVTLAGKPPIMASIPNQPCHAGAPPLTDESVAVDAAGHLQNVIVYIEDAPAAAVATNLPPVELDQKDCRYVPHVVALRTGQTLHITSSDPTLHNVHGQCTANDPFNFALVAAGQSKDISFEKPEIFPLRCDVHPWMKAYGGVFAHPWFAVSGSDGSFQITGIPSGNYTLVAWHEKYGQIRIPIKAADGQITPASFTFQSGL